MCGIVVASRTLDIDPDNVATPIAAALGDLVTLLLLAATGSLLHSLPTASTVSCRGKEIRNINIVTQFLVPGHIQFGFDLFLCCYLVAHCISLCQISSY